MKKLLRIAIYARVSTDEQKKFGFSISAQLDKLKKWCEENGYVLIAEFVDEGYTASNMKRPDLQEMLSRLNEFDVIAFTRLDRFSRNVLEANKMLAMLNQHNVALISIEEDDIDTTTADGLFMFQLKVSLAERELRKGSERIKSVFEYKVKDGQPVTGSLPIGYKIGTVEGKKRIVKDPETEALVMTMFEYFSRYHSIRKTMLFINDSFGIQKTYNAYRTTFKNPLYAGIYKDNENFCPPYISIKRYEENQKLIKKNLKEQRNHNVFFFSTLMKCPYCGYAMVGQHRYDKKYDRHYYHYRCTGKYYQHICPVGKSINESKIESFLVSNIDRLVKDYILQVESVTPVKAEKAPDRIKEIKEEMDVLNYQSQKRRITIQEYDREFEKLEKELAILQRNVPEKVDTSHLRDFLNSGWNNIYNSLTRENKRALWQNIIKEIVFDKDYNIDIRFL